MVGRFSSYVVKNRTLSCVHFNDQQSSFFNTNGGMTIFSVQLLLAAEVSQHMMELILPNVFVHGGALHS